MLFAVSQGGADHELRRRCTAELLTIGFDGYAFGGWPVSGDGRLQDVVAAVAELIPKEYMKWALGIGMPENVAADIGADVTLIDPASNPGGVCLYRGCIPSKALLHIAKVITEAREAESWGVSFGKPTIAPDKIREWKNNVVE